MLRGKFTTVLESDIDKMVQHFKHEHKDNLCFCCNRLFDKDNINVFRIHGRGYGSVFDTMDFNVQLCDKCAAKIKEKWFNNNCDELWGYNEKSEKELWNFLNTFKIENQEYIFNIDTEFEDAIARKDWIEMMKEQNEEVRDEMAWGFYKKNETIKAVVEDALQEELQDIFCEYQEKVTINYLNSMLQEDIKDLGYIENKMQKYKDNLKILKMLSRHKETDLDDIKKITRYINLIENVCNAVKEIA